MSLWEKDSFTLTHNSRMFTVTKIDRDVSKEFGKLEGIVKVDHKIEGFDIPLYMISDSEDCTFGFGHKVVNDGNDTGLFVSLQDESLFNEACEFVQHVESLNG